MSTTDYCPECRSSDLCVRTVAEHTVCGCIDSWASFHEGDSYCCPGCGAREFPEQEAERTATYHECLDCGTRFDAAGHSTAGGEAPDVATYEQLLESATLNADAGSRQRGFVGAALHVLARRVEGLLSVSTAAGDSGVTENESG